MQRFDVEVLLGEQLELEIPFTEDEAGLIPIDLTKGWIVEVVLAGYNLGIDPPVVLKEGAGFTKVTTSTIKVDTPILATTFIQGLGHWYAKVTNPAGKVFFPIGGRLSVGSP